MPLWSLVNSSIASLGSSFLVELFKTRGVFTVSVFLQNIATAKLIEIMLRRKIGLPLGRDTVRRKPMINIRMDKDGTAKKVGGSTLLTDSIVVVEL